MCLVTVVVLFYSHYALKHVQLIGLLNWFSVGLFYFPDYSEVLTNMLNLNKVYFVLLFFCFSIQFVMPTGPFYIVVEEKPFLAKMMHFISVKRHFYYMYSR